MKVESTRRPDPARRGFLADYGGIDRSPNFNEINQAKRSFQVDLSQAAGLATRPPHDRLGRRRGRQLPSRRDGPVRPRRGGAARAATRPARGVVVGERVHRPRSARGRAGEHLRRDRRAVGADGLRRRPTDRDRRVDRLPQRERARGRDPRRSAPPRAHRRGPAHRPGIARGRRGQLARRAARSTQLGVAWDTRIGNRHRELSPHDVYPAAGDDEWVAIAVGDDDEWAALCRALDRPEWSGDYPTAEARRANGGVIDDAITAWTSARPAREAFVTLQAAGVPAMAVMTNAAIASDPHVAGARRVRRHRASGDRTDPRRCARRGSSPDLECEPRPGPLIGQDNDYVLEHAPRTVTRGARPGSRRCSGDVERARTSASVSSSGGAARQIEALEANAPLDSLWVGGHIASRNPSPEAMMGLARLAALTERVRVGTSILLLPLVSAGARRQADRRPRPRHERAGRSSASASAASTRRSSAPARCRSRSGADAPTR